MASRGLEFGLELRLEVREGIQGRELGADLEIGEMPGMRLDFEGLQDEAATREGIGQRGAGVMEEDLVGVKGGGIGAGSFGIEMAGGHG